MLNIFKLVYFKKIKNKSYIDKKKDKILLTYSLLCIQLYIIKEQQKLLKLEV